MRSQITALCVHSPTTNYESRRWLVYVAGIHKADDLWMAV